MNLIQVSSYPNQAECGVCCLPLNESQAKNNLVVAHYDTGSTLFRKIQLIVKPKFIHHVHQHCAENWREIRERQQEPFNCPGGCLNPLKSQPPLRTAPGCIRRCWTQLPSLASSLDPQICIPIAEGAAGVGIYCLGYEPFVDLSVLFIASAAATIYSTIEYHVDRFEGMEALDLSRGRLLFMVLSAGSLGFVVGRFYTPPLISLGSKGISLVTGIVGGIAGMRLTQVIFPMADSKLKVTAGAIAGVIGGIFESVTKNGRLYSTTILLASSAANFVRSKFRSV